jgi:uncharacterized protein
MLLALLADTHDNDVSTLAALAMLREHKPHAYLHAGDLVSPEMLSLFTGLPFHFVFGNNEFDHAALRARARAAALHCHGKCAELDFAGKRLAMVHGHEFAHLDRLVGSGRYDYLVHGHSHVRRDERIGHTRIINPGALHRARSRSVALLDVAADRLEFFEVPSS